MSGTARAIIAATLFVSLLLPLSGCGLKTNPQPPAPKNGSFVSR